MKTKGKGRETEREKETGEEEEEQRRKVSRGRELKSKTCIPQRTNMYDPCTAEVNQRESNWTKPHPTLYGWPGQAEANLQNQAWARRMCHTEVKVSETTADVPRWRAPWIWTPQHLEGLNGTKSIQPAIVLCSCLVSVWGWCWWYYWHMYWSKM